MKKSEKNEANAAFIKDDVALEKQQNQIKYDVMREFARLRKEKKITQEVLSQRTGIARPNIARMENGAYNPTIEMMVRLADGIGMDLDIKWVARD